MTYVMGNTSIKVKDLDNSNICNIVKTYSTKLKNPEIW